MAHASSGFEWWTADLKPECKVGTIELLVDAFMGDPVWETLLPDAAQRKRFLEFLWPRRMKLIGNASRVLLDVITNEVVGHAALSLPGDKGMRPTFLTLMSLGMWQVPFRLGMGVYKEFDWIIERMKEHQEEVLDSHPDLSGGYYTLQAMGIAACRQGQGIGSKMLAELLNEANHKGMPTVLLTQKERNVAFYSRLGFKVLDRRDITLPKRKGLISNWIMVRMPAC